MLESKADKKELSPAASKEEQTVASKEESVSPAFFKELEVRTDKKE